MQDAIQFIIKLSIALPMTLLIFRLLRREVAQITPIDLMFVIVLGELVGGIAHASDLPIWHMVVVVPAWALMIWLAEYITKNKNLQRKIEGEPKLIIENGRIKQDVMEDERLNEQEIMMRLRMRGVFDLGEVDKAMLETSGDITVKRKRYDERDTI